MTQTMTQNQCLSTVTLDEGSIGHGTPDQHHERLIAIHDLVETSHFAPSGSQNGPYSLHIGLNDARLILDIKGQDGAQEASHSLSLAPFRKILKDYFMMCESYYAAIRTATPSQIEAIDVGRRAQHDEGAHLLLERLEGKITCDFDTARRLFTLITALHWKG